MTHYFGEIAALLTAVFWTVTSMSFESAGKKVGSLSVNLIRLVLAFIIYCVLNYFRRGTVLPFDAGAERWAWLALSGLVGFVIGDLLLFQSYVVYWCTNCHADYGSGTSNYSICWLADVGRNA